MSIFPTRNLHETNKGSKKEEVIFQKRMVAIVENPLYAVVNEPNSTAKRLMRKLSLLDFIDERNGSDKLNMLIQLPYGVSRDRLRDRAQKNIASIEEQLANSRFGIAYTDSAEKVFQLNRPLDNTLLGQIEFLTGLLYSQLGITKEIMDGTATPETMLNYYTRTIEPILAAVADEMKRKFLTKNARTRGQTIAYYRDQFRLVPLDKLAEMLGTMITNRVMTSNEARQIVVWNPGCGKGYETYSLACILKRRYPDARIKIYAHEVDLLSISNAPLLTLPSDVAETWYKPFVSKTVTGEYTFIQSIKDMILFEYHDCMHTNAMPAVDIIFARDVLSFMGEQAQKDLLNEFGEKVKGNGCLFLGDNEQVPGGNTNWSAKSANQISMYLKH